MTNAPRNSNAATAIKTPHFLMSLAVGTAVLCAGLSLAWLVGRCVSPVLGSELFCRLIHEPASLCQSLPTNAWFLTIVGVTALIVGVTVALLLFVVGELVVLLVAGLGAFVLKALAERLASGNDQLKEDHQPRKAT